MEIVKLPPDATRARANLLALPEFLAELREGAATGDLTPGERRYWSRLALLMATKMLDDMRIHDARELARFAADILTNL